MRTTPDNNTGAIIRRNFVHCLPEEFKVDETARIVCVDHQEPFPTAK
jgi:hypothetical protein